MKYSYQDMMDCAVREVRMRRRVYANRVETGRMSQQKADQEIDMMQEIANHFADLALKDRLL